MPLNGEPTCQLEGARPILAALESESRSVHAILVREGEVRRAAAAVRARVGNLPNSRDDDIPEIGVDLPPHDILVLAANILPGVEIREVGSQVPKDIAPQPIEARYGLSCETDPWLGQESGSKAETASWDQAYYSVSGDQTAGDDNQQNPDRALHQINDTFIGEQLAGSCSSSRRETRAVRD